MKDQFRQQSALLPRLWRISLLSVLGILSVGLLIQRGTAQEVVADTVSPLATPADNSTAAAGYGTVPPVEIVSVTVALPSIFAQLPQHLPLIRNERAPNLPTAPHPRHGATDQSPNVFLAWQLDDPDGSVLHYEIYLDANKRAPETLLFAGTLVDLTFDPYTLEIGAQYVWQVHTINEQGRRTAGPVWSFGVEPLLDPPAIGATVLVPAGPFWNGCDSRVDNCRRDNFHREEPLRLVYLDAFEIDKYEVTNGEYQACVQAGACEAPLSSGSPGRPSYYGNATYDYYPVTYVSWWNARGYCEWRGMRLPTDAEWEKAARGPIDTRPWPWGTDTPTCAIANFRIHCDSRTSQVGSYPAGASPYGMMDATGNVFEWVQDYYDVVYYSYAPNMNPPGPTHWRVQLNRNHNVPWPTFSLRSGSYSDNWYYGRVAHRHFGHRGWTGRSNIDQSDRDVPNFRNHRVGFRCARTVSE